MSRLIASALVIPAALAAVAVAAGAPTTQEATILKIAADKTNKLAFNKKALTAKAGKITIVMANPSILSHNVAIRNGTTATSKLIVKGKVVGKGGTSKATAKLKKKKYRYLCTVPGHEKGGMWGILTVK